MKVDYYRLPKKIRSELTEQEIRFFCDLSLHIKRNSISENVYKRVGFEVLGPMLYAYTIWLRKKAVEANADTIVFLSREGKVLERAYNELYGDNNDIRIEYINVSRLALAKATYINTLSWEDFEGKYVTLLRGISTLGDFFDLFEVCVTDEKLKQYKLTKNTDFSSISDKTVLYSLIKECGEKYGVEQNKLAKRYLSSKGLGNGTTIISDIGWSGTMQIYLQELFPAERLIGCYIGVSNVYKDKRYQKLERYGFWFGSDDYYRWQMIRFTESAFEFLFLCNEGTTISYKDENTMDVVERRREVIPIKVLEKQAVGKTIDKMHETAIECVRFLGRKKINIDRMNRDIWFIPYLNFAVYPNKETIEVYKNYSILNGSTEFRFIPQKKLSYYLIHPKKALKELELNNCKIIWLYGLIRCPLPYLNILYFLTNNIGMKSNYEKKYL